MGFAVVIAFEMANQVAGWTVYGTTLLSEGGGLVRSSAGFSIETEDFGEGNFDTVIIGISH